MVYPELFRVNSTAQTPAPAVGCFFKSCQEHDRPFPNGTLDPATLFLPWMQRMEIFVRAFLDTRKISG